jgi:hypothetical protein
MKKTSLAPAEWFYNLSFMLFLFGSSLAHIEHGSELSLWLMSFAVILTVATTLLPLAGIRWIRLKRQGNRWGVGIALLLQVLSWMSYFWAMSLRLGRNLPPFHTWITVTTLLWAAWLLVFIYSRHAHSS